MAEKLSRLEALEERATDSGEQPPFDLVHRKLNVVVVQFAEQLAA